MTIPPSALYAIIDPEVAQDPVALARRVLQKSCGTLQLRAKRLPDVELLALAETLAALCRDAAVRFFINDRPDIAMLVGADGVHLGQDDIPIGQTRKLSAFQIGVSTHSLAQAEVAERSGADYVAFGPVFRTATKENPDPVVGLENLRRVCRACSRPVVAIGGITPENAPQVLDAGAAEVAVISALPRFVGALD
ncbi:MAG: thiamine phosphate synthase [Myxococcota bacterium]